MELSEELTVREFFHLIRRRRKDFLVCWSLVFGVVMVYTYLVTPTYRATVLMRVQVPEETSNRAAELNSFGLTTPSPTFNIEQLLSPQVLEECVQRLSRQPEPLGRAELNAKVGQIEKRIRVQFEDQNHNMVSVSVTSHRPSEAALQANELSRVMVKVVGEEMTAKTERTRQFIEEQLRVVGEKLKSSEERLRESRGKIDPQSASTALGGKLMELRNRKTELLQKYTVEHPLVRQTLSEIRSIEEQLQEYPNQQIDVGRITREVHLQEDLFTMLTKRQEEAQILESAHVAPVTIIEPAGEPGAPESPNKRFNMMMGAIAGALLGLIVVMVQHHFDTSMITPEEIEQYLQLPVLAAIPHIERREANPGAEGPVARKSDHMGEARSRLIPNFPPQSPHAEVHHLLRNNLMRDVHNGESRVFLFTSSVTAEGKSITAANFAIAAAQSGIPTLLAEMDLREPMVHRLFGLPAEPGLMNFFYTSPRWDTNVAKWEQIRKGEARLNESMNQEGLSNLNILSAGRIPSNPVSLLSSDRFFLLIQAMRQRYPLVVLDGAPALLFADSSIVGPHVDGIILVYRFGRTAREVLRRTHNQLVSSNAKILGVVVNDIMQGQVASYNRYYGAYYKGYRNKASPLPPAA